jgi:hypothetical protein
LSSRPTSNALASTNNNGASSNIGSDVNSLGIILPLCIYQTLLYNHQTLAAAPATVLHLLLQGKIMI